MTLIADVLRRVPVTPQGLALLPFFAANQRREQLWTRFTGELQQHAEGFNNGSSISGRMFRAVIDGHRALAFLHKTVLREAGDRAYAAATRNDVRRDRRA